MAEVLCAGAVTGLLAWLAIVATSGGHRIAAVWPANAIILTALVRHPPRRWAPFLASGYAFNVLANLLVGDHPLVAAGIAACNSGEIVVCGAGLWLFARGRLDLGRIGHLTVFAAIASAASMASALGAGLLLQLQHSDGFWRTLYVWGMADMLGLFIVTPSLLALDGPALIRFLARPVRGTNLGLLALVVAVIAFTSLQTHMQLRYLLFAALMILSFKGETAGAALGLLVTGALFMVLTALGHGPTVNVAPDQVAVVEQLFLLTCAVVAFPVAGAMARRRELQATLSATLRDFETLAANSTDIVVRVDLEHRITYISPACSRFGYRPEDLVGTTIEDLIHPDDQWRIPGDVAQLKSGETSLGFERRARTKSGDWLWVEGRPQILRDAKGEAVGMVTSLREVTQKREAQQALSASEARYRMLADAATDIIVQTDTRGVIRYISPACRRLGFEVSEMIGRSAVDFVVPEDRAMATVRLTELVGGVPRPAYESREYRPVTRHGREMWLDGNSSVLHNAAGEIVGVMSVLRDVTERHAFEEELKRKRQEAEAATTAKSEFLANMSHEIRTPLTGIMGFAGLLEDERGLPPAAEIYAQRIATASRALLSVVNDILDFSKIEAGQVELDPQPFDPAAFAVETCELVAAQAQEKRLELRTAIDGALPAAVMADGQRLRQVLLNLLTNAVKFTERGGVTVGVGYDLRAERLRISVTDTGAGIPKDRIGRLFQRFSQADGSITRRYGGTGLGLAICKSLTSVMGGDIGVESEVGRGSTFWFTVAAPPCDLAEAPDEEAASDFQAQPARVLVVDDSPVNRELVGALLGVFGHDLTEAGGGAEAIEIAGRVAFDLILMDLQMPGMDGLTASRRIRASSSINRDTPILALSANILPMHLDACREAGMNDHIGKPIDTRELLTKVARWTSERAPTPEADATIVAAS
ncbi:MAG TPA: PAS domain S-box protein [Caulobacteraceae bacterium]